MLVGLDKMRLTFANLRGLWTHLTRALSGRAPLWHPDAETRNSSKLWSVILEQWDNRQPNGSGLRVIQ